MGRAHQRGCSINKFAAIGQSFCCGLQWNLVWEQGGRLEIRPPARFVVIDLWSRQQHGVDDVDHTVRLNDVGDAHHCRITPGIR